MEDNKNHFVSTNVQFTHSQSLLKNLDVQGFFCDKERVFEDQRYNQGCCCYSCDLRRTYVIIDHSLEINNRGFQEENGRIKIENFSSVQFSPLYQTSIFCS